MSTIQTGIELNDQFTSVIYGIINSVNLAVSSMADMQQSVNADIDTSSLEGAREEINQVTMAMDELNAAMQNPTVINTDGFAAQPMSEPVAQPDIPKQSRAPPTPVEIPVTWDTDGLDVFTGTGIDRFQQEVQSTNTMLNTLNTTQAHIQQTASGMDILPDAAVADINTMGQRLQMVQQRIQAIENNPVNMGIDAANAELEQLRSQLNQAIQEQNNLNSAMDNMDVSAANDAYLRLSNTISSTERYVRDNMDSQGQFNQKIQEGASQANSLTNSIKGAVAAYVSIQTIGKVLNISDKLVQTQSRLSMMNDGLQTTEELTNMVYAAAQDARGSFSEMADVVARFGNNAKDAFGSSAEVVTFAGLIQKQMTIAGASTTEASNAMLQLSQGLGSGVLRGDELNSIFEQAPNLIQNIADYLNVPIGQIREMASEGGLTADIVKAAIFSATDEINAKFEQMPMTWGQVWKSMQNTAIIAFRPVLERINEIANSEGFQTFVNGAIEAMAVLANIVLNIFDLIGTVGGFIADNWSIIAPIIYGVISVLALFNGYLIVSNTIQAISNGLAAISVARSAIKAGATLAEAAATTTATGAQVGLNAALLACPIVWIIILIIGLIAALVALCNWIANVTGAANSGIGIIVGALAVTAAFIGNLFITLINLLIDVIGIIWNYIANFAEFFANVFNDPVGSIVRLFAGMADSVLGILGGIASVIDTLFGSNLADAVSGWRSTLEGAVTDLVGEAEIKVPRMDTSSMKLDRFEYGEAWDAGVSLGDGIASAINNFSILDLFGSTDMPNSEGHMSQFGGMADNLGDIADDTGNISDAMDITEEDLKYLRDIAEQEAVNRYTVAEVNIDQSGMQNTIKNGDDLDGFMSGLTDAVNEAVDNITEGVHE